MLLIRPSATVVSEWLNRADYLPTLSQPGRQICNLIPCLRFSLFLRRGVPPRYQFVWFPVAANHPVVAPPFAKRLRLKRHDVFINRLIHSILPVLWNAAFNIVLASSANIPSPSTST
jgi:hypothetical protein